MQKRIILFVGLCKAATVLSDSAVLTLEQALATALKNAPELRAGQRKVRAAEEAVNGSIYCQPLSFRFDAEGVGGGAETEYTLMLEKKCRGGNKSENERVLANKLVQVVKHASSVEELELTARVKSVFYEVMAHQEISVVRSDHEVLAREFVADATKRFNAGESTELDVLQADLALGEVLIEKQCCLAELDTAKKKLAALMGIPPEEVKLLEGNLYDVSAPTSILVSDQHPLLLQFTAQVAQLEAAANLALSQDSPDTIFGAGVRYNSAFSEPSYVFSASRPFACSTRGSAESAAHRLEAEAMNANRDKVRRDLQIELAQCITAYQRSMNESSKYKTDLLPRAEKIYDITREGYVVGRYSWVEVIIAQRHIAEMRIRYIESLSGAHQAIAQMDKYTLNGSAGGTAVRNPAKL
jgi:outer membrane protein, heavy metal efflux system